MVDIEHRRRYAVIEGRNLYCKTCFCPALALLHSSSSFHTIFPSNINTQTQHEVCVTQRESHFFSSLLVSRCIYNTYNIVFYTKIDYMNLIVVLCAYRYTYVSYIHTVEICVMYRFPPFNEILVDIHLESSPERPTA